MKNDFSTLDFITIAGFIAQMDNIEKDEVESKYIRLVIKSIANEIEKLHKENDVIMKQNEEIIKILKERDCD